MTVYSTIRSARATVVPLIKTLPRVPLVLIAGASLLLLGTGWVHGTWTQRWQGSEVLDAAARQIDAVPWSIDGWKGERLPVEPEAITQAGLKACWMRNYVRPGGGAAVTVVLMCGRAGPTCVHTPQWCFGGAGYEMTARPERIALPSAAPAPAQFWSAPFVKDGPAPERLRVCWAWSADGTWEAPDYPRVHFAGRPALYKLYVIRADRSAERADAGPEDRFLRQLLDELHRTLFVSRNAGIPGGSVPWARR